MGWASETARAAAETFEGAFPGEQVVVAAAAVDADGTATALGDGCPPPDGRFELAFEPSGQITGLRVLRPGETPPW